MVDINWDRKSNSEIFKFCLSIKICSRVESIQKFRKSGCRSWKNPTLPPVFSNGVRVWKEAKFVLRKVTGWPAPTSKKLFVTINGLLRSTTVPGRVPYVSAKL